jgi:hypothetical protein
MLRKGATKMRWLRARYSLGALLVAITALCCLLAIFGRPYYRQEKIVSEVKRLGGKVFYANETQPGDGIWKRLQSQWPLGVRGVHVYLSLSTDRMPAAQVSIALRHVVGLTDVRGVSIRGGIPENELNERSFGGTDSLLSSIGELPASLADCRDELQLIRRKFPSSTIMVNYRIFDGPRAAVRLTQPRERN